MINTKGIGAIFFYIFIIIFIVIAYLNNAGILSTILPKKAAVPSAKKNIIEMEYKQKEYKVNFAQKYADQVVEIAGFEQGEKWHGENKIDDVEYWDGAASFVILSQNSKSTVLSLTKSLNLSNFGVFKILVYSADEENTDNIKRLTLRLGNKTDSTYYEYDISNIRKGWNVIRMAKDNFTYISGRKVAIDENTDETPIEINTTSETSLWGAIEKITVNLVSRPNSQVELSLDRLWAEKDESYQKDFLMNNFSMLSTKTYNGKTYINQYTIGGSALTLVNKVTGVKNFTYTAKIIPQIIGAFDINARTSISTNDGYYLELAGVGSGMWQLYKIGNGATMQLDSGELANFLLEANTAVWLRITTSGESISGYFSTDGINFTRLTEKSDSEIKSGGIGFHSATASFMVESIDFNQ